MRFPFPPSFFLIFFSRILLTGSKACFLSFFLYLYHPFLDQELFFSYFSWSLSWQKACFFLFSYFLVFFHKFQPQYKLKFLNFLSILLKCLSYDESFYVSLTVSFHCLLPAYFVYKNEHTKSEQKIFKKCSENINISLNMSQHPLDE